MNSLKLPEGLWSVVSFPPCFLSHLNFIGYDFSTLSQLTNVNPYMERGGGIS